MRSLSKIGKQKEADLSERIRSRASEAIEKSDLSEILELMGARGSKETDAALKIIMADKLSQYAIKSRRIAQKRGRKISPSAVILAAEEVA
jgi:hypothetical protein